MKNQQKGFLSIILLSIIALCLIGVSGYYIASNNTKVNSSDETLNNVEQKVETTELSTTTFTTTKKVEQSYQDKTDSLRVESKITADVVQTVDCGNEDCFNKKFASCQPATLHADIGVGSVEYKILTKGSTGCNLSFKYTKYPDPSWENKDMTCQFDNKISFEDSMNKVFKGVTSGQIVCKGPLFDILKPR
jgi:hypothetical protein